MTVKYFYITGQFADESEHVWYSNDKDQYQFSVRTHEGFEEIKDYVDSLLSGQVKVDDRQTNYFPGDDPGPHGYYPDDFSEEYWQARRDGGGVEPYLSPTTERWTVRRPLNMAYGNYGNTLYFKGLDKPIVDQRVPSYANLKNQVFQVKCHPVKIGQNLNVGLAADYIDGDYNWEALDFWLYLNIGTRGKQNVWLTTGLKLQVNTQLYFYIEIIMSKKKGRPLESPLPRDIHITVRLNKQEFESLKSWCWRYDTQSSDVIRDVLEIHSIIPTNPVST